MQENTNGAIALNTIVLYAKMAITTICALFTTRFALQALGNSDFGLFSVLGGIISFVAIFNTIMLSTSNRFIAVAIGKGDIKEANKQFNVCLAVHVLIAIITLLIALPIGDWYIHRFINYDGNIDNALLVYNISIIGSILSFIGVPYNGILMAKERFITFSIIEVAAAVIKLIISFLLISHFRDKLLIYTITLAALTAIPTFAYWIVCRIMFSEIVRIKLVTESRCYKDVFDFSAWVAVGAVTFVGRSQGSALIINAFFNTIMNTALGIANSINSYIALFAQNVTQPMSPQIMKSYANGDNDRVNKLLTMSTKFAYLTMLVISAPFLVAPEALINLWLGSVPPYVVTFTVLLIVDHLVQSLNSGINNVIFASGKIKIYQIVVSVLNVLSVVIAFLALYLGYPAYTLVISYIFVSIIRFFAVQWVLHRTLNFENEILVKSSYLPSILVTAFFLPILALRSIVPPIILIALSLVYVCILVFFVGMNTSERTYIISIASRFLKKNNNGFARKQRKNSHCGGGL